MITTSTRDSLPAREKVTEHVVGQKEIHCNGKDFNLNTRILSCPWFQAPEYVTKS